MRPAKALIEQAKRSLRLANASTDSEKRQKFLSAGLNFIRQARNLDPALVERTCPFGNFEDDWETSVSLE